MSARGSNLGSVYGPAFFVVLALLSASALGLTWGIHAYGVYLEKKPIEAPDGRRVAQVPKETEHWIAVGPDRIESAEMLAELGTENYLSRTYQQKDPADPAHPQQVELHLAYYTGQIDTVPHVPERCFVGGGLAIDKDSRKIPLRLDGSGWIEETDLPEGVQGPVYLARLSNSWSDRPGSRVRLPGDPAELEMLTTGFSRPGGGGSFYSGYFFVANGGTVASANDVRLLAFKLTDDYSYYLKVQFTSFTARDPNQLAELAASLLDDLYAEIARCVPDWVEVRAGRYPPEAGETGSDDS